MNFSEPDRDNLNSDTRLFLLMINDLAVPDANLWKYVDDTTEPEIISKGAVSNIQESVDHINNWSTSNNLLLNLDKCKELQIFGHIQ